MRLLRWTLGLLVLLSLGLPFPAVHAEGQTWSVLRRQDGLAGDTVLYLAAASSTVACSQELCEPLVVQLLVGTSEGLSVWDGRRWVSYAAGNGLAAGSITAAALQDGVLWAGSWGGGLSALVAGRWRRYTAADSPLPSDWISALAVAADGLWIATYDGGLARWSQGNWTIFTRQNSGLPSDWLTCLWPEADGGLWVGTLRDGLAYRAPDGSWQRYALPDQADGEVTALARQGDTLWVGTRTGAAVLALGAGTWRSIGQAEGLPSAQITALAPAADGGLWVGTPDGLAHWRAGVDASGLDASGLDASGLDASGLDASGLDAGGVDAVYTRQSGLAHDDVSALAVDATGRLWVGSYVRGLAVQGTLAAPEIARLPVVLVHGWHGPDNDTLEDSEFWHLATQLRKDGFEPYYATDISPANTLAENAARLRDFIAQVRAATGAPGVYLIAYSMGGLNARAYLESTLYQSDVARAFILGSPQRGEYLWQTLLTWEYLAWSDEPSALELLPLHADLFNSAHSASGGVPYTLIAGDAQAEELPTLFSELPPSDGLVSTWSALYIGNGDQGAVAPDVRVTDDIHAWSDETLVLGVPSLLLPMQTYDAHIRPYLFGMVDAPGTGTAAPTASYTQPELDPQTALRTGSVQPGQTVTLLPWSIDATGRARFLVRWKGESLEARLRDPQGRVIDATSADSSDDAEYLELDFADVASYVITDTVAGPWSLVLEAPAENQAATQYVAYAWFPSSTRLSIATDRQWYRSGDAMAITATIESPGAVEVASVRVAIYSPRRQSEIVTLAPVAEESEPGRVHYAGVYRLSESGYYVLLGQATGTHDGLRFERGQTQVIGVWGQGAVLTGEVALEPATGPATPAVRLGLHVSTEGPYLLALSLARSDGTPWATVAHPVQLAAGDQTVRVPLDGVWQVSFAGEGLLLQRVQLLDISGAAVPTDELSAAVSLLLPAREQ